MKDYGEPDAEWTELGVTPIGKIRVPIGIFRWKLEKEGYETVLAAASTWNIGPQEGQAAVVSHAQHQAPPAQVRVGRVEVHVVDRRPFQPHLAEGAARPARFALHDRELQFDLGADFHGIQAPFVRRSLRAAE